MNIFVDSGGGCDRSIDEDVKVKVIQCMVCNPDGNSNICSNDDDKGTLSKCSNSDKSCVKKVAKSKYTSGFSRALSFQLKFQLNRIQF